MQARLQPVGCYGILKVCDLMLHEHEHEKEVVGARGSTRQELEEAARLASAGLLTPMVSDTFPLEGINEALGHLAAGRIIGRAVLIP